MSSPSKTPEKCTICLAQIENRSVIDGCLHAFCYSCLKEWSKVKAVCPLCKQPFTFFMHSIRADDDFDKYEVPVQPSGDFNSHLHRFMRWENETNRVVDHWMSSRIHEWRERIQQDQENARAAIVAATSVEIIRRRRRFYREGIQVSHVRNNKRIRDISSRFFHDNPPQIHRLVPWLKRELIVLFGANNMMLVNRVCDLILSAVPTLGIQSADFYNELKPYLLDRTDHFLKEFVSYATSPHELASYDNNARYPTSQRRRYLPTRRHHANEAASWSSDEDEDSHHPRQFLPHLYSTSLPEPPPLAHVRNQISLERNCAQKRQRSHTSGTPVASSTSMCIVISSSSSDESEVEFVRFIKPPHLRTPDAVIAVSSDEEIAGPSQCRTPNSLDAHRYNRTSLEQTQTSAQSATCSEKTIERSDDSDSSGVNVTLRSVVVPVKKTATTTRSRATSLNSSDNSAMISNRLPAHRKHFSSESNDSGGREFKSFHKPLKKVIDRKRSRQDNDLTRRIARSWSSSSDSDDFASPYIYSSSQRRDRKLS